MQTSNLFTRDDTFFGICEAIGEDFGFNANWLRLALAGALFFSPVGVIAFYFLLGGIVALSRWLAPAPRADATVAPAAEVETPTEVELELPLAA